MARGGRLFLFALGMAWLGVPASSQELRFAPGLYEVEMRLLLPHVPAPAAARRLSRCMTEDDLRNGRAFAVLGDNPIRACALADYRLTGGVARYVVRCPGPNAASAEAEFEVTTGGYRGTIAMQMGGKNMTMAETHLATRLGDCPP